MRYRFIDAVLSATPGPPPRIEIAKTFPPGDDAFSGPGGGDRVPHSLLLELLAMAGGELIFRHLGETRVPLLLKAHEVTFEGAAMPGQVLNVRAELTGTADVSNRVTTAEATGEVYASGIRIAAGRLLYLCAEVGGLEVARYRATT